MRVRLEVKALNEIDIRNIIPLGVDAVFLYCVEQRSLQIVNPTPRSGVENRTNMNN
jgi:hypothetical protein